MQNTTLRRVVMVLGLVLLPGLAGADMQPVPSCMPAPPQQTDPWAGIPLDMRKTIIAVCTATRKSPVDQVACIEKEIADRRALLELAKVEEAKRELARKKLQQLLDASGVK